MEELALKKKLLKYINTYKYKSNMNANYFYGELIEFIRTFSKIFLHIENFFLTVSELEFELKNNFENEIPSVKNLSLLLRKANDISFSNKEISEDEIKEDLELIQNTFNTINQKINEIKKEYRK